MMVFHRLSLMKQVFPASIVALAAPFLSAIFFEQDARSVERDLSSERQSGRSTSPDTAESQQDSGMFLIRGRPDAPIVENDRLPLPQLPQLNPEEVYPPLDYVDFIQDPDIFFLFAQEKFELNLDTASSEMENFSSLEGQLLAE